MKKCCEEKCSKKLYWIFAIVGFVAVVAGIAYAVYRYCTPDYLDEFDDMDKDELEDEEAGETITLSPEAVNAAEGTAEE